MRYYVDDAFACGPFTGNPAGVCVVEEPLTDEQMQSIAAENRLSETAFVSKNGNMWDIRWFTPVREVGICGHATLGTAYVIMNYVEPGLERIVFNSRENGILTAEREGDVYYLDFPLRQLEEMPVEPLVEKALGVPVKQYYHNPLDPDVIYAMLYSQREVDDLEPDIRQIAAIPDIVGVVAMAKGDDCDYVSRFFAPKMGIDEDPVTGAIEMCMIPLWKELLGKDTFVARQLSKRRGLKFLKHKGDRVSIGGRVEMFIKGEIVNI